MYSKLNNAYAIGQESTTEAMVAWRPGIVTTGLIQTPTALQVQALTPSLPRLLPPSLARSLPSSFPSLPPSLYPLLSISLLPPHPLPLFLSLRHLPP